MLKLFLFVWVAATTCYSMKLTNFNHKCPDKSPLGTVNSVSVDGCSHETCVIHPGHSYTLHVNFTAATTITQAKNVLHGIIGGVAVAFPVSPSNNCGNSMQCPIQPGTTVVYTITLRCPGFAPAVKMASKWELQGAHAEEYLCYVIPLEIARTTN